MLAKADNIFLQYTVRVNPADPEQYIVEFTSYDKHNDHHRTQVVIGKDGEDTWNGDLSVEAMIEELEASIEAEKQKRIKAEKRKELIASLTEEQRDLLGVVL